MRPSLSAGWFRRSSRERPRSGSARTGWILPTIVVLGAVALGAATALIADIGTRPPPFAGGLGEFRTGLVSPDGALAQGLSGVGLAPGSVAASLLWWAPWAVAAAVAVALSAARARARRDRAALARWRRRLVTDPVTGLPNARAFARSLDAAAQSAETFAAASIAVSLPAGATGLGASEARAKALRALVNRAVCALAPGDRLFATDEGRFAMLCHVGGGAGRLGPRLRAMADALAGRLDPTRTALGCEAAIGVALAPRHGRSATLLGDRAGLARAAAEAAGGDRIAVFRRALEKRQAAQAAFDAAARHALATGALDTAYQPIVALSTGAVIGWEALTRWPRATDASLALAARAGVDPEDILSALERSGAVAALTERLLNEAASAQRALPAEHRIAINVAAAEAFSADFLERLMSIAAGARLDLTRLDLEIAGGGWALAEGATGARTVETLAALRRSGLRLVLDGFGEGLVRPGDLARAPVDRIKLSRAWVGALDHCAERRALVDGTLRLAESLGVAVDAAGVETETQAAYLRRRRCAAAQGFRFGRPGPLSAAIALTDQAAALGRSASGETEIRPAR